MEDGGGFVIFSELLTDAVPERISRDEFKRNAGTGKIRSRKQDAARIREPLQHDARLSRVRRKADGSACEATVFALPHDL